MRLVLYARSNVHIRNRMATNLLNDTRSNHRRPTITISILAALEGRQPRAPRLSNARSFLDSASKYKFYFGRLGLHINSVWQVFLLKQLNF